MKKITFPFEVKRGSVSIKIYRTPSHGCESFTISDYLDGFRKRPTFPSFARAKEEAEAAAGLSERYLQCLRWGRGKFASAFQCNIGSVVGTDIDTWLRGLKRSTLPRRTSSVLRPPSPPSDAEKGNPMGERCLPKAERESSSGNTMRCGTRSFPAASHRYKTWRKCRWRRATAPA